MCNLFTQAHGASHPRGGVWLLPPQTVQWFCVYLRVFLGVVFFLGVALYLYQVRRNRALPSGGSYKLAGMCAVVSLLAAIVFGFVLFGDYRSPAWPREFVAGQAPDFSGVPGVSPEQELWASALASGTFSSLRQWSDYASALRDGFVPVSDLGGGDFLHVINFQYLRDDVQLDPALPESLLYRVENGEYTLLAAMYMMPDRTVDDPVLRDLAGPLVQWHNHSDLARGLPLGTFAMVHVWVTSNKCGVFAAADHPQLLGRSNVPLDERVDVCL